MDNNQREQTAILLQDIYTNVRMATLSIDKLQSKEKAQQLRTLLDKQNDFYEEYTHKVLSHAQKLNIELKDLGCMVKMMTSMSTFMKTLFNNSTSHIASLFVKGTNTGIEYLSKSRSENKLADETTTKLADEQIENMKNFLNSLLDFV